MGQNSQEKESVSDDVPYWRRTRHDVDQRASEQGRDQIEGEARESELHEFA